MELTEDKSSLYRWDHLMNVAIDGTGVIPPCPKTLADGTKIFNAGFHKFVNLVSNYTPVLLDHCQ